MTVLNEHIAVLNWQPHYTSQQTQACFQTYIEAHKSAIISEFQASRPTHTFFLQTLSALTMSAATLGFFAHQARNESFILNRQANYLP